ncbi:hypothetical protein HZC09_04970 [Candidatus Micrarchaeota archaeon]|nr:hypothetical protein [Candidatus Micrarchaeota archaeon]
MATRGIAFVLAFSWLSVLLPLISSSASMAKDSAFWEDKLSALVYREAVGWDVKTAFSRAIEGKKNEEKILVMAEFERFLENDYPVSAEAWAGYPFGLDALPVRMMEERRPLKCLGCIDLYAGGLLPQTYGASLYAGDWAAVEVFA